MKHIYLILLLSISILSCSNDDKLSNNITLESIGIIGNWEINTRGIDNVISSEEFCCVILDFSDNENTSDLTGNYYHQDGATTNGIFTINPQENSITFTTENDNTNRLFFSLNANQLVVWYFEGENRYWIEYQKYTDN